MTRKYFKFQEDEINDTVTITEHESGRYKMFERDEWYLARAVADCTTQELATVLFLLYPPIELTNIAEFRKNVTENQK